MTVRPRPERSISAIISVSKALKRTGTLSWYPARLPWSTHSRKGAYAHGDRSVTRNLARAFTEAIIACCQDSSGEGCVTVGEINEVLDQAAGAGNEGVTLATMVLGAGDRICMAAREQAVAPESKSESTVADAEIVDVAPTGAIADDLPGAASPSRTRAGEPILIPPAPSRQPRSDPRLASEESAGHLAVALVVCVILAVALVVTNRRALSSSQASSTPTVRVTTTQTVNHDRTVTQTVTPTPTTTTYPGSAAFNSLVQTLPAVLRSDCAEDPDPRFVANARCTYSGRTVSYAQFESPTAATEWVTNVAPTADAPCTKPETAGQDLIVRYRSGPNSGVARCGWYRSEADGPPYFGIAWSIPDKSFNGWVSTRLMTDAGWAALVEYWKLASALS